MSIVQLSLLACILKPGPALSEKQPARSWWKPSNMPFHAFLLFFLKYRYDQVHSLLKSLFTLKVKKKTPYQGLQGSSGANPRLFAFPTCCLLPILTNSFSSLESHTLTITHRPLSLKTPLPWKTCLPSSHKTSCQPAPIHAIHSVIIRKPVLTPTGHQVHALCAPAASYF